MKRTLYLIGIISLVLIIGLTVAGCEGGGGSPSAVYRQAFVAIEKGDMKTFLTFLEPDMAALLSEMMKMLEGYEKELREEMKAEAAKTGGIAKIEERIDGDTAYLTISYNNGSTENDKMVRVNGKWKMTMGK